MAYDGGVTIYLDDQPVELGGEDLGAVVAAARVRLEPLGRLLVEVQWDGCTLGPDEISARRGESVAEAQVRLYSADPGELVCQALEQIRCELGHAGELQAEAAEMLQQDRQKEAMRSLGESLQSWQKVQQALIACADLLGLKLEEVRVDGLPLEEAAESLIERLKGLRDLIVNRDTVGLADALAYEWPAITQQWDRFVGDWIERLVREDRGSEAGEDAEG